jgi:hypothetical protein
MIDELDKFRKYAIQGGITAPLCNEYRTLWRGCGRNKAKLAKLAMQQQSIPYFVTHCYKGKGLTKGYIKEEFGDFINESNEMAIIHDSDGVAGYEYALYVDFKALNKRNADVSCFMWSNVPLYEIKPTKAQILYIACDSNINLSLSGYNNVTIYLFDKSTVTITDMDDTSNLLVYKYSNDCNIHMGRYCTCANSHIKQFNKQLVL